MHSFIPSAFFPSEGFGRGGFNVELYHSMNFDYWKS